MSSMNELKKAIDEFSGGFIEQISKSIIAGEKSKIEAKQLIDMELEKRGAIRSEYEKKMFALQMYSKANINSLAAEYSSQYGDASLYYYSIIRLSELKDSYNNERVIADVDLDFLLDFFALLYGEKNVPISVLSDCFGMAVHYYFKQIVKKKREDIEFREEILVLSDYYRADGTLIHNEDIDSFLNALLGIAKGTLPTIVGLEEFGAKNLIQRFKEYLKYCNSEVLIEKEPKQKEKKDVGQSVSPVSPKSKVVENQEKIDLVRKYYRNYELVAVPQDVPGFLELVKKLGMPDNEIRFIEEEIERQMSQENNNSNIGLLDKEVQKVYLEAKDILNGLPYYDPYYYQVVDAFQNLDSSLELFIEASLEEREYLQEEIDAIIVFLKEFCSKYGNSDEKTANNLLFLSDGNISLLEKDSMEIDKGKRKNVSSLFSKLNKDNQGNFRKVLMSEKSEFVPYEISGKGLSLFFTEVDQGIYAILGVFLVGNGYKEIANRVMFYQNDLKKLESQVKGDLREQTLRNGEEIKNLVSLNLDALQVGRN